MWKGSKRVFLWQESSGKPFPVNDTKEDVESSYIIRRDLILGENRTLSCWRPPWDSYYHGFISVDPVGKRVAKLFGDTVSIFDLESKCLLKELDSKTKTSLGSGSFAFRRNSVWDRWLLQSCTPTDRLFSWLGTTLNDLSDLSDHCSPLRVLMDDTAFLIFSINCEFEVRDRSLQKVLFAAECDNKDSLAMSQVPNRPH